MGTEAADSDAGHREAAKCDDTRRRGASPARRRVLATGIDLGVGAAVGALLAGPAMAQAPAGAASSRQGTDTEGAHGAPQRRRRIFITGSTAGLGHAAASSLLAAGHEVVVHARSRARLDAVEDLVGRGAIATIGDLAEPAQVRDLAAQVNAIGSMDAVIHNAGINSGPQVLVVNVMAPYLLTALIQRPERLVYLSSAMHKGGRASLERIAWTGRRATGSYADSKLFVTTLCAAVARRWPDVYSNAVNPGWVPTRMGGPNAPDDLRLGHLTQEWLATSDDPQALTSGGYWYQQKRMEPHPVVHDTQFQEELLGELARVTGVALD